MFFVLCTAASLTAQPPTESPSLPSAAVHAYAIAELGRHAEALQALENLHGAGNSAAALVQEQQSYDFSLSHTQTCSTDKPSMAKLCIAEDLLAVGRLPEALAAQKQQLQQIQAAQKANLRKGVDRNSASAAEGLADETDSTGGKLVALADAYDLAARIEAAMGRTAPALKSLDAAEKALPPGEKTRPRAAGYAYHRALILAESGKYPAAAKACSASITLDAGSAALGPRRNQLCEAITASASKPAAK